MRILHLGFAVTGAMALLAVRPKVQLAEDEVTIAASRDDLLAEFKRRFAQCPEDILAMEEHRLVRRFAGKQGPYSFRTVELVTYENSAITFEHLAGPFSECHERFEFTACPTGTCVTHTGSFRLRGGLWTALLAIGPVKRAFETHVRRHLDALATERDRDRVSAVLQAHRTVSERAHVGHHQSATEEVSGHLESSD